MRDEALMEEKNALASEFKALLQRMLRVEDCDLDFGVYRILNARREAILQFVEAELPSLLSHELKQLRRIFSVEAVNDLEMSLYRHLIRFFSRYYDEGDFFSLRRFSKKYQYVIPYNGEETFFYWVNSDQYYVKTTEDLTIYRFVVDDRFSVFFHVVYAVIEKGNVKASKKPFFLLSNRPFLVDEQQLHIYFEYRPLTDDDLRMLNLKGAERRLQQHVLDIMHERLVTELSAHPHPSIRKLIMHDNSSAEGKSMLYRHMTRFIRRNTSDYYIHKNLKEFLLRELDIYLKSEVLNLDHIIEDHGNVTSPPRALREQETVQLARLMKKIAVPLIEFLDQLENFQKTLWEKKKFIIESHYVISINVIAEIAGEDFLRTIIEEILENKAQLREWQDVLGEKVSSKDDLKEKDGNRWKSLPLDTRYFSRTFKWRLLTGLSKGLNSDDALDDHVDGILIKSENWQALNLLLARYREQVKLIYIDPPFNKEQEADYLYKVKYKDAAWLTLLENRLRLARELLHPDGSIFVRCDYNGNTYVRLLLDQIFGKHNFRNEIIVKRGSPKAGLFSQFEAVKSIGVTYDNLYWYSKRPEASYQGFTKRLPEKKKGYWSSFKKIYDRPTMRYDLLGITLKKGQWMWKEERARRAVEHYQQYLAVASNTRETLEEYSQRTGIREFIRRKGNAIQYWVPPKDVVMLDNNWLDIPGYSSTWGFKTENSEVLLKRVIEAITAPNDIVLDFFLGSGTTIAVAQKLGRKWIGVEMGDHFWDVILPRMKTVLHYDKSGVSRDSQVKKVYNKNTAKGFFKYLILEQYEDALENVTFRDDLIPSEASRSTDYTVTHSIFHESKRSPTLVNVEAFKNPFTYKLRVIKDGTILHETVDVIETFNYLLGLKTRQFRHVSMGEQSTDDWIIVLGIDRKGRKTCIVWRPLDEDVDFKEDARRVQQVMDQFKPEIMYINGDCAIPDVRSIEPTFKALMVTRR